MQMSQTHKTWCWYSPTWCDSIPTYPGKCKSQTCSALLRSRSVVKKLSTIQQVCDVSPHCSYWQDHQAYVRELFVLVCVIGNGQGERGYCFGKSLRKMTWHISSQKWKVVEDFVECVSIQLTDEGQCWCITGHVIVDDGWDQCQDVLELNDDYFR